MPMSLQLTVQYVQDGGRCGRRYPAGTGTHRNKMSGIQRLHKLCFVKRQLAPQYLACRRLQLINRQLRAGDACLHRRLHHGRHDLVRQAKGQAGLTHQGVGQFGGRDKTLPGLPPQMGRIQMQRSEESSVELEALLDRRQGLQQGWQNLVLDVLRVAIGDVVALQSRPFARSPRRG